MKKVILFILSTVFVLFIPNIVHAETTGIDFTSTWGSYGSSQVSTVGLNTVRHNFGDSTIYFSFGVNGFWVLPYTATINMSNGDQYSCSLSSVASFDGTSSGSIGSSLYTISAYCPINMTYDKYPVSVSFYRMYTENVLQSIYLPQRVMVVKGTYFDSSSITNSQQQTTNAINGVNDSINNDTVSPNSENSSTAQSWASQSASDSVVSDMVLMPITLLNAFSSGFNGSCQAYNLGSLYGTNLTLPCINISNYLGATLWGIIDVLMSGFLIYGIGKKFVRVFNDFTNLKDSQVDELYGGGNE